MDTLRTLLGRGWTIESRDGETIWVRSPEGRTVRLRVECEWSASDDSGCPAVPTTAGPSEDPT